MEKIYYTLTAPLRWIRKGYDWTAHWAKSAHAPYALFLIAFMESSFFPIPPDVLLIAMVMHVRKSWIRYALICTAGSVAGAFLGYFIGWSLYETAGKLIVQTYNLQSIMELVGRKYSESAFLTVFAAAFTPIPYKVITIAAGLFKIPLWTLFTASAIGRGARFFMVAGTLRVFGKKISDSLEKYFDIFSIAFMALIISGVMLLKYFSK